MTPHSSILGWEIPWTEEPGGYSPWGGKESDMTEQLNNNINDRVSQIPQVNALVSTEHTRHWHLHLILTLPLSELSEACNRVLDLHQDLEAFSILPL